jgi:hypothetical protein
VKNTTATLLLTAGVPPFAVQRILRHSDPKLTTEIYGHLVPGFLRDAIDRLRLQPVSGPFATRLLPGGETAGNAPEVSPEKQPFFRRRRMAGATGFEPVAFAFGVKPGGPLPSGERPNFGTLLIGTAPNCSPGVNRG